MSQTLSPEHDTEFVNTGWRRKIAKFALTGVAVLGVGAALTSAAWSDSVFFKAPAKAATFELEGYNPTTGLWENADSAGAAIVLSADAIDGVGPGIADRYTVSVRNGGTVNITLANPTSTAAGSLFNLPSPAVVAFSAYTEPGGDGILLPGEQANIDVIVTGNGAWTGTQYQGATGTVTVQIQGQS